MLGGLFPESIFGRKLNPNAERRLRLSQARAEETIIRAHVDNALMFVDTLAEPYVAFRANSLGTMITLIALGHGIGLAGSAQLKSTRRKDVVLRPICGAAPSLTTCVLHSSCGVSEPLEAFIEFARELLSSAESTDELF